MTESRVECGRRAYCDNCAVFFIIILYSRDPPFYSKFFYSSFFNFLFLILMITAIYLLVPVISRVVGVQ